MPMRRQYSTIDFSRPLEPFDVLGLRDRALPERAPDNDIMTQEDITDYLLRLNDDLRRLEMVVMSSAKIEALNMYLAERCYTFTEAEAATMFILFGRRTDFTARGAVKPEYFWPRPEDMTQFARLFVIREDFDAAIGELKRQAAADKTRLVNEVQKKDKLIAEMQKELQRASGKRAVMEEPSAIERTSIELSKKVVDLSCRAVDAESRCRKLEFELALAEHRIARYETMFDEYELVEDADVALLPANVEQDALIEGQDWTIEEQDAPFPVQDAATTAQDTPVF